MQKRNTSIVFNVAGNDKLVVVEKSNLCKDQRGRAAAAVVGREERGIFGKQDLASDR